MRTFLSVIHFTLCIMVMVVVLLQRRKQGGFSGMFGGGTQMDSSGQWQRFTGLSKLTVVLFVLFMLTSVVLSFIMA